MGLLNIGKVHELEKLLIIRVKLIKSENYHLKSLVQPEESLVSLTDSFYSQLGVAEGEALPIKNEQFTVPGETKKYFLFSIDETVGRNTFIQLHYGLNSKKKSWYVMSLCFNINAHAGKWSLRIPSAVKSILSENESQNSLHIFFVIILNFTFTPLRYMLKLKSKF